VLLLAT